MKKMLILAAITFANFANAGPLGFSKGMNLQEIRKIGNFQPDDKPYWYQTKAIVSGHENFESYSALVVPGFGLCKIVAVGRDIIGNSYGEQLKSVFDDLSSALSKKYGTPSNEFNFLRSGSIWKDNNDFMMGLLKSDRTLASYWSVKEGSKLMDSLSGISLRAGALSNSKGYINVSYEFDNISECSEAAKSKSNSNL